MESLTRVNTSWSISRSRQAPFLDSFDGRLNATSFTWMNEQRKLALTRAYLLVRDPENRMVERKDWVRVMSYVNPDCRRESVRRTKGGGKGVVFFLYIFRFLSMKIPFLITRSCP